MRRLGAIVLAIGIIGFLVASSRRGSYDSVEGALKTTFSQSERGRKDFWETARWLSVGVAVVGVVLVILPGKKG